MWSPAVYKGCLLVNVTLIITRTRLAGVIWRVKWVSEINNHCRLSGACLLFSVGDRQREKYERSPCNVSLLLLHVPIVLVFPNHQLFRHSSIALLIDIFLSCFTDTTRGGVRTTNLDDDDQASGPPAAGATRKDFAAAKIYQLLNFSPETASPETDDLNSETSNEHNVSECPTIPVHGSSHGGSYMNPSTASDISCSALGPHALYQYGHGKNLML